MTYFGAQPRQSLIDIIANIYKAMIGDMASHLEDMQVVQQGKIDSTTR